MAVTQASDPNDPTGMTPIFYSSVTGQSYADAQSAHDAEASMSGASMAVTAPSAPSAGASPVTPNVYSAGQNGQIYNAKTGVSRPMTDQEKLDYSAVSQGLSGAGTNPNGNNSATPTNPNGSAVDQANAVIANLTPKPAAAPAPYARAPLAASVLPVASPGNIAPRAPSAAATSAFASLDQTGLPSAAQLTQTAAGGAPGSTASAPPAAPPKVDTSKSDAAVAGVNNTISQLLDLANKSPQTSAAEAQLMKADQLAKIRDQQSLAQNESAALGAARSGNRRDQGLAERQAIGESTFLGQADQRNQVVQQAELEGNLATLRAQEEQTDFTNRANILSKAADLGLNVAGLQVDVGKADLGAASNFLNDQFQQMGIDKQVSVQQTQNVLSFMQGMSTIQFDYDKMSDADKQHTLDLMMQQYGIDKAEESALAQIKANKKFNWSEFLAQAALGGIAGTSAIAAAGAGKK